MTTTITNSRLNATINTKGAELISFKSNHGKEYIWNGNPDFWGKHSPVLFPIVGTLKSNRFSHNGKNYLLPRHGFARDVDFELIENSGHSAIFSLVSTNETLQKFPFEFEFRIIYSLDENALKIGYEVLNKTNQTMFFSLGAHPAFALPENFEDYSIEMKNDENLDYFLLENDLLSNKTEHLPTENKTFKLNYPLFEKDALIFKNIKSHSLKILEKGKPFLEIDFKGFPHLGIWTKIGAKFICIEPWFGYSDTIDASGEINEKEAIQTLKTNEKFTADFTINTVWATR